MKGCETGRKRFYLYPSETALGWRVIRMVSQEQGEMNVAAGEWRRVLDSITHYVIGYQLCSPSMTRGDFEMPSFASSASISTREMQVNAGEAGRSCTAHLSDDRRLERRVPEDHIERVQCKVLAWPKVGAAKGDILRVWPRGQELLP